MTIHHLQLWVPDLGRAERSWGWLLHQLDYELENQWDVGRIWRKDGAGIVIEQSPDMVPGMLYSRLRPGMNHVAVRVAGPEAIDAILAEATDHGWTILAGAPHPLHGSPLVAYLEDTDGFEVELVAPTD